MLNVIGFLFSFNPEFGSIRGPQDAVHSWSASSISMISLWEMNVKIVLDFSLLPGPSQWLSNHYSFIVLMHEISLPFSCIFPIINSLPRDVTLLKCQLLKRLWPFLCYIPINLLGDSMSSSLQQQENGKNLEAFILTVCYLNRCLFYPLVSSIIWWNWLMDKGNLFKWRRSGSTFTYRNGSLL